MKNVDFLLGLISLAALLSIAGCDRCQSDADCYGATPVCDVEKCGCLDDDTCACAADCRDAPCADGWTCDARGICVADEGTVDPDCE